jgi:hypothetical protein
MKKRLFLAVFAALFSLSFLAANAPLATAQDDDTRIKIDIEPKSKPFDVIKQLRAENVIPTGGKIDLQLPRSIIESRKEGGIYLPIGRGAKFRNFVFTFTMRLATVGSPDSACGMDFRFADDENLGIFLFGFDGRIQLAQYDDNELVVNFDKLIEEMEDIDSSEFEINEEAIFVITIVALDENLTLFINGLEIATETTAAKDKGIFAMLVSNPEGNDTLSQCRYSDVWVWSLD